MSLKSSNCWKSDESWNRASRTRHRSAWRAETLSCGAIDDGVLVYMHTHTNTHTHTHTHVHTHTHYCSHILARLAVAQATRDACTESWHCLLTQDEQAPLTSYISSASCFTASLSGITPLVSPVVIPWKRLARSPAWYDNRPISLSISSKPPLLLRNGQNGPIGPSAITALQNSANVSCSMATGDCNIEHTGACCIGRCQCLDPSQCPSRYSSWALLSGMIFL